MKILGPTEYPRLNEGVGIVFLGLGIAIALSLVSYHPEDPSWNTATAVARPLNLIGRQGAYVADGLLQIGGLGAFTLPVLLFLLAWKWLRSEKIGAQYIKFIGASMLVAGVCTAFSLGPQWRPFGGAIAAGGLLGTLMAEYLLSQFNTTGAILLTASCILLSLYLVSKFSMAMVWRWFEGPVARLNRVWIKWQSWREIRRHKRQAAKAAKKVKVRKAQPAPEPVAVPVTQSAPAPRQVVDDTPPWEEPEKQPETFEEPEEEDIPIHALEDYQPRETPVAAVVPEPVSAPQKPAAAPTRKTRSFFQIPSTELIKEPQGRPAFDAQELKDIAARIKAKFEEFNVLGSVVQINPGPVVTTFEFKPEAGIKYSRITTLTEDLCLGLQAESILIERIPGKPTVGIEVPNTNREVINLRQILESDEFRNSQSPMTMSLGKDISGRIKVASLESMPHLLIAGSTGSGKSVMLNTMIMSLLYKSTPNEVRMIMVDPKRVELGIYEGIPHLLTPVITDARKATNALRNAVLEMERRLKLLAAQGVRNIDQYNRKIRQMQQAPRNLFEDTRPVTEELEPPPTS